MRLLALHMSEIDRYGNTGTIMSNPSLHNIFRQRSYASVLGVTAKGISCFHYFQISNWLVSLVILQ